ncbi:hypothetical protein FSG45_018245, partial [Escherichia coli]|nr:hypothetical protein [Escherichia coli]
MSQQEYTIHIFGQDLTSQDGLFRLDEIRRVGVQIGKVADGNSAYFHERRSLNNFHRDRV